MSRYARSIFQRRGSPVVIKLHQQIVNHDGDRFAFPQVFLDSRQAQGQEKLVAGALAHASHRQPHAIRALAEEHLPVVFVIHHQAAETAPRNSGENFAGAAQHRPLMAFPVRLGDARHDGAGQPGAGIGAGVPGDALGGLLGFLLRPGGGIAPVNRVESPTRIQVRRMGGFNVGFPFADQRLQFIQAGVSGGQVCALDFGQHLSQRAGGAAHQLLLDFRHPVGQPAFVGRILFQRH